jgi:hypothetical protein
MHHLDEVYFFSNALLREGGAGYYLVMHYKYKMEGLMHHLGEV